MKKYEKLVLWLSFAATCAAIIMTELGKTVEQVEALERGERPAMNGSEIDGLKSVKQDAVSERN